jgi:hypothetical protein
MSGRMALRNSPSGTLDRILRRNLARRGSITLIREFLPSSADIVLREQLGGQIEVNAAGTAGDGGTIAACNAAHRYPPRAARERRLWRVVLATANWSILFVVALLQIDDLTLARTADEYHRKTVVVRVGERVKPFRKARR